MSARDVDNSQDVLDSRDVIARIEELREEREELQEALREAIENRSGPVGAETAAVSEWEEENGGELAALESFAAECEGYCSDWEHGEQLVRDSYFTTHAQELAEECGDMDSAARWPYTCIDWDQAARELQQDYSSAEFDGVTYWFR